MANKTDKPEEKQYSLKPIERQMLNVLEQQYFTTLSNFLSFVSIERFAYTVTENTRFRVEGDNVFITEDVPEEPIEPTAVEAAPSELPKDKKNAA